MRFMQTESVLQTKNRSGPATNRFSVALLSILPTPGIYSSNCPLSVFKEQKSDIMPY